MITRTRPGRLDLVRYAGLPALLALALTACGAPNTLAADDDRRPVDLGRAGSVTGATGAAVPLALCARSETLARTVGASPILLRLPAICAAAGQL